MRSCAIAQLRKIIKKALAAALLTQPVFPKFQDRDKRDRVEERSYRQSRLYRVFGNPVAFTIAQLLLENGEMSNVRSADHGSGLAMTRWAEMRIGLLF